MACRLRGALRRWRQDRPTPAEEREIGRLAEEIERLKPSLAEILALSAEIRTGTIDRITEMSDAEIGLKALLGQAAPVLNPNPTLRAIRERAISHARAF